MTNMFEGDNETPWLTPGELHTLGFSMILYPTTILFRVVKTIQNALADLRQGKPTTKEHAVDLTEYEVIVDVPRWALIEKRFVARQQ
jgi:2-methylisocitrate lyase-like PEP mutase family enzyme